MSDEDREITRAVCWQVLVSEEDRQITRAVCWQVLVSDDGIEIYWDGIDQLIVIIPMNYTGELCGICGALEGDPTDLWKIGPACSASGSLVSCRSGC